VWSVGVILTEMLLGESFWRKDCLDLEELIGSLFMIRRISAKNQDWIRTCPDTVGINPVVLQFLQFGILEGTKGADKKETIDTEESQEIAQFLRDCLNLDVRNSSSGEREPAHMRSHAFLKSVRGQDPVDFAEQRFKLWNEKPYIQSSTLTDYEGEVERLRIALSNGKDSETGQETPSAATLDLLSKLPLSQVYYLWKLTGGDVEAQFRRDGRLAGTPSIQLLPKVVHVAEDREERPSARDIANLFSDVSCSLPLENLEAEIMKSIREPNKDQFSWDTDYFLLSDPEEMNFLQGTMSDDRDPTGSLDAFLYPDAIQSTATTTTAGASGMAFNHLASLTSLNGEGGEGGLLLNNSVQSLTQQPTRIRVKVPLSIREKDLGYQYHRLSMFTELLLQYPASRMEILHHSKIDIPPLLRGKVWAAILGVVGDYQEVYEGFDKYTEKSTDRQIELGKDIGTRHEGR